jgi:hypothetical protein
MGRGGISRDRDCRSRLGWLRTVAPRCAPGESTPRAQQRTERRRARFEHPMLTINQRPFPPEGRPNLAIGRGSQEPHRDRHFGRADHQLHDAAAPPVGVPCVGLVP